MRRSQAKDGGFTLLETLVVVGIVALVAVGIAGIFSTVGDTITRGKRVSELNRTAAQIERVMREDFAMMSREGFLVIRNEYANRGQNVKLFDPGLYEAEPNERPRRIDEIAFFAASSGKDFKTARRALHPSMIAESSTAQVYYGHGKKMLRPVTSVADRNDRYHRPMLTEHNYYPGSDFGVPAAGAGVKNPNEFASDWSLLRRLTLLVAPGAGETQVPEELVTAPYGIPRVQLIDSRKQVALQPALQSIFRGVADQRPFGPANAWGDPQTFRVDARVRNPIPRAASGLVDIAVTDLSEIRNFVNHMDIMPNQFGGWGGSQNSATAFDPRSMTDRALMQAWMLESLPGDPSWFNPNRARTRIRYESEPPLATIQDSQLGGSVEQREFERSYREADQEMLTSAVFVPRCTEFIVEWSYGLVDQTVNSPTYKQLLWYGLPRYEDVNENGTFNAGIDVVVAQPFLGVPAADVLPQFTGETPGSYGNNLYPTRALINAGVAVPPLNPGVQTEVSLFGYFDPGPGRLPQSGSDPDDGSWSASSLQDPSDDRPWLWPALIRVTMTVADRSDPTIEATYQAVFEVPNGGLKNR
jgi:prepilin-type N-terminal cleavage/methylation domain-containing protein